MESTEQPKVKKKITYEQVVHKAKEYGIPVKGVSKKELLQLVVDEYRKRKRFSSSKKYSILQMLKEGKTRSEIASTLQTPYSYVHSVAKQFAKEGGDIVVGTGKGLDNQSISGRIRELWDQGFDRATIRKMINVDYSHVHNVIKRYELSKDKD